jgi:uncharacterized protein YkwD
MRRITSLALALIAVPALLAQCATQMPAQQRDVDVAQPQIIVHILATSPAQATQAEQAGPAASATSTAGNAPMVPTAMSSPTPLEPQPTITPLEPMDGQIAVTPVPTDLPFAKDESADDVRAQLLGWHNQARAEAGLPAFGLSVMLQSAAQGQADYLAAKPAAELMQLGPAGHRGPNGDTAAERAARCGYEGSRITENWAYFDTVQAAFEFWLTDQWHRPQVLSSDLLEVGFGISQHPEFGLVLVAVYGRSSAGSA